MGIGVTTMLGSQPDIYIFMQISIKVPYLKIIIIVNNFDHEGGQKHKDKTIDLTLGYNRVCCINFMQILSLNSSRYHEDRCRKLVACEKCEPQKAVISILWVNTSI